MSPHGIAGDLDQSSRMRVFVMLLTKGNLLTYLLTNSGS